MNNSNLLSILFVFITGLSASIQAQDSEVWKHYSSYSSRFITVEEDVQLQVLDWGGSGRSIVLLAGFGNTAHVFNQIAKKLTNDYHVYGITRRGFGLSSHPDSGYDAVRLGDDVLSVLNTLQLEKPFLIGHSIAGLEMSSVATRFPDRIAGLIYLDAAYQYAFDGDGSFEKLIEHYKDEKQSSQIETPSSPPMHPILKKIHIGAQSYKHIPARILAIYAYPSDSATPFVVEYFGKLIEAFEKGVPDARVVKLAGANHYVFRSNEAEVIKEIHDFIGGLPSR